MSDLDLSEFNENLFLRINNLIKEYNLICEGETVAVALSGGKDSVLTLHALKNYQQFVDFDLIAISVDEGIADYRQDGVDVASENADNLGIKLIKKSFKKEEGFILDDIYMNFKSACIPDGIKRLFCRRGDGACIRKPQQVVAESR